jgi:hypothetical protein
MSTGVVVIQLTGSAIAVIATLLVVAAVLWISALVSVLIRGDDFERGSQLLWALVILLAGPVGAVLYFSLARHALVQDLEPIPDRRQRTQAIAEPWSESKSN